MKMNKMVPFALSALLISGAVAPAGVFAKEGANSEEMQMKPSFVQVGGTIEDVEKGDHATLYTINNGDDINVLAVTDDALVFDNTGKQVELEKGDKVDAYTDADKPMTMIYPPQYNVDVVIVETEKAGSVAVGTFDEELLDASIKLQLNISEDTDLSSASGKKVKKDDLADKDLLVFYTMTTRSIPAQTTPEKVVLLDGTNSSSGAEENFDLDDLVAADHHMVDGVKMIPLRLVAEGLGYQVKSTGIGAIVTKGAKSFTITRGEKMYGYNKSLRQFEVTPELLETWKTYVPVAFIDDLTE